MRRLVLVLALLAFAAVTAVPAGATVAAKTSNPCKLLKKSEIQQEMGQPTSAGKKGLINTAVSKTCIFEVAAAGTQPDGEVSTYLQSVGAKIAFDANRQIEGNVDVDEIPKAYYDPRTGALTSLKGDVLVVVQSVFITTEGGIHSVDRKAETIELMKIARPRV
jgi:hypothetical protein